MDMSTSRCSLCAGISLRHLLQLSKKGPSPHQQFYSHHQSVDRLEKSAAKGCDVCQFILTGLKCSEGGLHLSFCNSARARSLEKSWFEYLEESTESSIEMMIFRLERFADAYSGVGRVEDHKLFIRFGRGDSAVSSFIPLQVSSPWSSGLQIDGIRVGYLRPDPDLGSLANFNTVRSWMSECDSSHEACRTQRIWELPTRVIDVENNPPRLILSHGARHLYAALSHCWGGKIGCPLTTGTLDSFQQSLPEASLPVNFHDAIRITRELKIKYLWVDCLCIIQDCKGDWETESKKMMTVYRHASLTISAMASPGSDHGILSPDSNGPLHAAPVYLHEPDDLGRSVKTEFKTHRFRDQGDVYFDWFSDRFPLSRRGWTLQESLLSPRILTYTQSRIYWKCLTSLWSTDSVPPGISQRLRKPRFETLQTILSCEDYTMPPVPEDVLREWYDLVSHYSRRRTTQPSDKLPAISGIAMSLEPVMGGTYLAGLWSSDIQRGLLWASHKIETSTVASYRAPSWSWARAGVNSMAYDIPHDLAPSAFNLRLVEHMMTPRDKSNPFGEIKDAYIIVEGFTKRFIRNDAQKSDLDLRHKGLVVGFATFDYLDEKGEQDGHTKSWSLFSVDCGNGNDYVWTPGKTPKTDSLAVREEEFLILVVQHWEALPPEWGYGPDDGQFAGAIGLRHVDGEQDDVFERVAHIHFERLDFAWMQSCKRLKLKLL